MKWPKRIKRRTFVVYLEGGASFTFKAESFVISHVSGVVTGYEFKEALGSIPYPLLINPAKIIAVTQKESKWG